MWPTYAQLEKNFPHARLLDITVNAETNANCLDVENGDATIEQAPDWVKRQIARKVYRPCLYTSAGNLRALVATMSAAGVPPLAYRVWSAHYTGQRHLCAPFSCGFGVTEVDGTQFTSKANGHSLDESVLNPEFFDTPPAPEPALPAWEGTAMNKLPTLQEGIG